MTKQRRVLLGMLAAALAFGMAVAGCNTGDKDNGGGSDDGWDTKYYQITGAAAQAEQIHFYATKGEIWIRKIFLVDPQTSSVSALLCDFTKQQWWHENIWLDDAFMRNVQTQDGRYVLTGNGSRVSGGCIGTSLLKKDQYIVFMYLKDDTCDLGFTLKNDSGAELANVDLFDKNNGNNNNNNGNNNNNNGNNNGGNGSFWYIDLAKRNISSVARIHLHGRPNSGFRLKKVFMSDTMSASSLPGGAKVWYDFSLGSSLAACAGPANKYGGEVSRGSINGGAWAVSADADAYIGNLGIAGSDGKYMGFEIENYDASHTFANVLFEAWRGNPDGTIMTATAFSSILEGGNTTPTPTQTTWPTPTPTQSTWPTPTPTQSTWPTPTPTQTTWPTPTPTQTSANLPNPPYGKGAFSSVQRTSLTLYWNASIGATGYKLYYATQAFPDTFAVVYTGTATTYTHTNLLPNTKYYYKITATNSAGESDFNTGGVFSMTTLP